MGMLLLWGFAAQAQDPVQWAEAMRAFAAEDATSAPPTNAIVFTGSSSIVFWKTLHEDMAPLTVINRGFGGSTMREALYWLDKVALQYRPRAVVLYEGDNDIGYYGLKAEKVVEDFKLLAARLHTELPATRLYFLAIKPSILRWKSWPEMRRANELIRAICERDPRLQFIDVASPMLNEAGQPRNELFEADDLHLNAKGYALWASLVRPVLLEEEGDHQAQVISPARRVPVAWLNAIRSRYT